MARLPDPATRQRWQRLIHLYDDAGCSIADFSDLHEVSTGSFYAWRRRLDAHAQNDGFLKVEVAELKPAPTAPPWFISGVAPASKSIHEIPKHCCTSSIDCVRMAKEQTHDRTTD
jgi:transposase-like protein